jgi:hypothetical protein
MVIIRSASTSFAVAAASQIKSIRIDPIRHYTL